MAKKHLVDWTAIEFDPAVVKAFLKVLETLVSTDADGVQANFEVQPIAV